MLFNRYLIHSKHDQTFFPTETTNKYCKSCCGAVGLTTEIAVNASGCFYRVIVSEILFEAVNILQQGFNQFNLL